MKTLFTIGEIPEKPDTLILQVGEDHCSYGFLDRKARAFDHLSYGVFEENEDRSALESLLPELKKSDVKLVFGSAFAHAMLLPQQFAGNATAMMAAVYDLPGQQMLTDTIPEWQNGAAYYVSQNIYAAGKDFSEARFFHSYTASLKIYNGFVAEDQIMLDFSPQHFRVIVKKQNALVLAQTYAYRTPLDVAYFLLKICSEFGLDQSHVFLILSGLVEANSAMYHELHHYFLNMHFAAAPDFTLPVSNNPHYYFNSLYNLAACVS